MSVSFSPPIAWTELDSEDILMNLFGGRRLVVAHMSSLMAFWPEWSQVAMVMVESAAFDGSGKRRKEDLGSRRTIPWKLPTDGSISLGLCYDQFNHCVGNPMQAQGNIYCCR
jgi:hypothetical protein